MEIAKLKETLGVYHSRVVKVFLCLNMDDFADRCNEEVQETYVRYR